MADDVYRSVACAKYECLQCLQMDCRCTCHILEDVCDLVAAGVRDDWQMTNPVPSAQVDRAAVAGRGQARTEVAATAPSQPSIGSAEQEGAAIPVADPACEFDYVDVSDFIDAASWEGWSAGIT